MLRIKKKTDGPITLRLDVLRRESPTAQPYWQRIPFATENPNATVASALTEINRSGRYTDTEGNRVLPIQWDCGCLQRKCGACAMVIAGRPRLACDTFLREFPGKRSITVEPLTKFPCVADLIVDRSVLFENLKAMEAWPKAAIQMTEKKLGTAYEASRCLQCGCCLEVCPNFQAGEKFCGAAGFVPTIRLLSSLPEEDQRRVRAAYYKHAYSGCGKSLSCQKICPAGIAVDRLLVNANTAVFWKYHGK